MVSVGSGDSLYFKNFFNEELFDRINKEVSWETMTIAGKELCRKGTFQGNVTLDGTFPLLRCPSFEGLKVHTWTPTVKYICDQLNNKFGTKLNHVKIQIYKDEMSFINGHTDKTLDLEPNVGIYNVRLGSNRNFVLTKKRYSL